MIYTREKDLQVDLATRNLGITKYNNRYIRREFAISECIPDIVLIGLSRDFPSVTYPKKLTSRHVFVLWLIKQSKKTTPFEISERSFQRLNNINRIVKDLIVAGAVIEEETGELCLHNTLASLRSEVVAIEAKLSNWRQALAQAKRYQAFADKVVVAMDADKTPRQESILDMFREQNIGLCAVSRESLDWLVAPSYICVASFEKEIIISSALCPSTHTLWRRR